MEIEAPTRFFDDLFFKTIIDRYVTKNPRFLHRDWLAEEVLGRLQKPGCRFVLVVGEPGAGKSSFIAQLASEQPERLARLARKNQCDTQEKDPPFNPLSLVYFTRQNQIKALQPGDAKSFLLRMGYQLSAQRPELFDREQLHLEISEKAEKVGEEARLVGASFRRLLVSPFYKSLIQIWLELGIVEGEAIGLEVEELVLDDIHLKPNDVARMGLDLPARSLRRIDPSAQIIVLVDGLDEIRYQKIDGSTIIDWLTDLPAELPSNVRFVLTSRPPDKKVEYLIDKQQDALEIVEIRAADRRVQRDLRSHIKVTLSAKAVQSAVEVYAADVERFKQKAVARADGNIGYLDALARGVEQAVRDDEQETLRSLVEMDDLPPDMYELFAFFLKAIRQRVENEGVEVSGPDGRPLYLPAWRSLYRPLLGTLAVAFVPLSVAELKRFGQISLDESTIVEAIGRLSHYLDREGNAYRFYHATVAEFLTDNKTKRAHQALDFYPDPVRCHQRIVDSYEDRYRQIIEPSSQSKEGSPAVPKDPLADAERYFWNYYAHHLRGARQVDALYGLVNQRWMQAKTRRFGRNEPFLSDVDLALQTAWQADPTNLEEMIRCCLVYSLHITSAPPPVIQVLAAAGQAERALAMADNITFAVDRCLAYTLLAQTLAEEDVDKAPECLEEAVRILPAVSDTNRGMALYWIGRAALELDAAALMKTVGKEALTTALELDLIKEWWQRPNAHFWAGMALRQVGDVDGLDELRKANLPVGGIGNQAWQTMSVVSDLEGLRKVFDEMSAEKPVYDYVRNMSNLVLALADAGLVAERDEALAIIKQEVDAAGAYEGPPDAHKHYVWALALAGRFDQALDQAAGIKATYKEWAREERVKALHRIVEQAKNAGHTQAVDKALDLAEPLTQVDDWRLQSRLASLFLAGNRIKRALALAEMVCDKSIATAEDNTLTFPRRREYEYYWRRSEALDERLEELLEEIPEETLEEVSEETLNEILEEYERKQSQSPITKKSFAELAPIRKIDSPPLRTERQPVPDAELAHKVWRLAKAGDWAQAENTLAQTRIPEYRAQALKDMALAAEEATDQKRFWLESIYEARQAGWDSVQKALRVDEDQFTDFLDAASRKRIEELLIQVKEWWVS